MALINYFEDGSKSCGWSLGLIETAIKDKELLIDSLKDTFDNTNKIELFELLFKEASSFSGCDKTKKFRAAYSLYETYPEIQEKYLFTDAYKIADRFILKTNTAILIKTKFDDGIDYNTPIEGGLYFIGETHFNPITHEEFYWVKIGKSSNLAKRMRQYNTCCPMLWRIDFAVDEEDLEEFYHDLLYKEAIATCNHNEEWFMVDRKTYLEMCEKGFAYFD